MSLSHPGTWRVQAAQMDVLPGQPSANLEKMLALLQAARRDRADAIVFPEMAIPGYLLGDVWERESFLRDCEACAEELRLATAEGGPAAIFGSVAVDWSKKNEDGRVRKYNACFVAADGRWVGPENGPYPFVIKTLLPNYREFDDSRHFYDTRKLAAELGRPLADLIRPVRLGRLALGCILCEDAWDADYGLSPLALLARRGVDVALNLSCSPFTFRKNQKRHRVFSAQARTLGRPLLYVNNTGIQNNGKTVFTFDGASCLYDPEGRAVQAASRFEETLLTADLAPTSDRPFGEPVQTRDDDVADLYAALVYGAGRFLTQSGLTRVVVGASGGIDSAVAATLFSRIVPRANLLLANLPSRHNSGTTIRLARDLAAKLGCFYAEIPIEESAALTARQVDGLVIRTLDGTRRQPLRLTDFMKENVQARDRSSRVLAALACAFGGVFTCNANKAEATVGYTTLYGDLGGFLAPLADLWKGEVYALGEHLNRAVFGHPVIPPGCFTITPSAELSPAQNVDEGKGDPLVYPYHDKLFASWVESWNRATPEDNLAWYRDGILESKLGYEGRVTDLFPNPAAFVADLERWWGLYQGLSVAKRVQAPPVLAVKRRAFGFDHREAILPVWTSRRYQRMKQEMLVET
jgi:NAD+ synthase (glutamine-hydrolysing)